MIIVTYHAVADTRSPIAVTVDDLRAHLTGLRAAGFTFVSMDACAAWLSGETTLPARTVAVTFDDGYRSVVEHALPLLVEHRVPAMLYVIGGRVGGSNQWPGQWSAIREQPLATVAELQAWTAAGLDVGNHSWTHPSLPGLSASELDDEVVASADRLEEALGVAVRHFAYPYGHFGARDADEARRRHRTAVTTIVREATRNDDRFRLPRIDGHDVSLALATGCVDGWRGAAYYGARRTVRRLRRLLERAVATDRDEAPPGNSAADGRDGRS